MAGESERRAAYLARRGRAKVNVSIVSIDIASIDTASIAVARIAIASMAIVGRRGRAREERRGRRETYRETYSDTFNVYNLCSLWIHSMYTMYP